MPIRMRRAATALAGIAVGASILTASSPALASAPQAPAITGSDATSGLWAGYYTEPSNRPVLAAVVNFTVPTTVRCQNSRGLAPYYGAMWVGIGGISFDQGGPAWLEQAGVEVTCAGLNAKPVFQPFWEVVPTAQEPDKDPIYQKAQVFDNGQAYVQPGDHVQAQVFAPADSPDKGSSWYFGIVVDNGNGPITVWNYYQPLPKGVYTGQTAEVITEWPTGKANASRPGHPLPSGFVDLGTVSYTQAAYISTTANSQTSFFSLTSHTMDMLHPYSNGKGPVAVHPGQPYTSQDHRVNNDSFDTYYNKNWWQLSAGGNAETDSDAVRAIHYRAGRMLLNLVCLSDLGCIQRQARFRNLVASDREIWRHDTATPNAQICAISRVGQSYPATIRIGGYRAQDVRPVVTPGELCGQVRRVVRAGPGRSRR